MNDHPLVYCNGDSYSDQNFFPALKENTYAHVVGQHLNGFVINNAIKGSCNRRIVRTSVHDLIQQRQLNPEQKIIALISLSFELRFELWHEDVTNADPAESNFCPHMFSHKNNWRDLLLGGKQIADKQQNDFLDKYYQGRAYYYSPYAERINLMCDLVMFQTLMKQLDIKFLIFQGPMSEELKEEYLLDFFKSQLSKENFFDFEKFSFTTWCYQQGFEPIDFKDQPLIGHYSVDAHRAFAEKIIIPQLEKL